MSTLPERIEQAHRKQLIVDTKRATALGKSVSQFRTDRASAIEKWTHSIRNIMKEHGAADPVECLPAIVASVLEHAVVAAAMRRKRPHVLKFNVYCGRPSHESGGRLACWAESNWARPS